MKCFVVLSIVFCSAATAGEVAFLGVASRSAEVEEVEGLSLPRGAGLVVKNLPPGGPAESVLELDDLLYKYNDQLLINPEQLLSLVRMGKPGEEVELTWFRGGEAHRATVALGGTPAHFAERSAKRTSTDNPARPGIPLEGGGVVNVHRGGIELNAEQQRDFAVQLFGGALGQGVARNRTFTTTRDGVRTVFKERDGNQHLHVVRGGEVLFDGAVNTPAQRREIPDDIRADLEARGLIEKAEDVP